MMRLWIYSSTLAFSLGLVFNLAIANRVFGQNCPRLVNYMIDSQGRCIDLDNWGSTTTPVPSRGSSTPAPSGGSTVSEIALDERLYPGKDLPYSKTVSLGDRNNITAIGVLTDWWQKRPTEIRVYESNRGQKGKLVGSADFSTYSDRVCGPQFNRKCRWSDDDESHAVAQLLVPITTPVTTSEVVVEVNGLLDRANEYVLLMGIRVVYSGS
ncbi:hypothetical protein [Roseofilum casamattae]|uniref:Secreted protein n=1 Tax=Roseofilum casamattae BLCC-M143 TaxID=3022442 RepID=A0ABT7BVR5_9CYAN|nr:hypothetical protein [Roseofilum casamattae]MDJ1183284.1 hypothetical protein [Roseofilum casamattae BLCC-M143]